MGKRVLIVQNFDKTVPGLVGDALHAAGIGIDLVAAQTGDPLPPDHAAHDGIVVLGGGQNALDDADSPWFPHLLELLRGFAMAEKPALGICLGAQLMARAFGGQNRIGGHTEFGWHPVALTGDGQADPVFGGVPAQFPIFQWHDDHFTLPPHAVRLATNGTAENQCFRIGRAAYGFQFHFEADRALVEQWNTDFAEYLSENHPGWAVRHPHEASSHGAAADAAGRALAANWAQLVTQRPLKP